MSYVYSEAPKKVKDNEWGRYNPGWVDVSVPGHGFKPHPDHAGYGVTYLWVFKFPTRLIIGIEAANIDGLRGFLEIYKIKGLSVEALRGMLNMGHPTLSAEFEKVKPRLNPSDNNNNNSNTGNDEPVAASYGQAFYGGELIYGSDGWTVNNHSGRHSGGKKNVDGRVLDQNDWHAILERIAGYCQSYMGISVGIGHIK